MATVAAAGNLLFLSVPGYDSRWWLIGSAFAWFIASLGLLSVWLGVGRGPLFVRLLIVGAIGGIAAFFIPNMLFSRPTEWHFENFDGVVLVVVTCALPFGLLNLAGFRLQHDDADSSGRENRGAALKAGQFSIGQLFGWTAAAAILAGLARVAQFSLHTWILLGLSAPICCSAAVGTVCTALAARRTWACLLCLLLSDAFAVALSGGFGIFDLYTRGEHLTLLLFLERSQFAAQIALAHAVLLNVVFLLYRRLGYRYTRQALQANSSRQKATTELPIGSSIMPLPRSSRPGRWL